MSPAPDAELDIVVIGAGVVGLACAAALAREGREVVVLERNEAPARETSSRNSGVIHAGLYYPPDSLKARACVEGAAELYARCQRLGIPHRQIGKLIVASDDAEVPQLEQIAQRGQAAGAVGLDWLGPADLRRREPNVVGVAALWSPGTGIVDAHALADSYRAELEAAGGQVVCSTSVEGLALRGARWAIDTRRGDEGFVATAGVVVNAAGLGADHIAELAGIDVDAAGWRIHPCKGDYFGLAAARGALVSHLVYPVPARSGLGVHATVDLGGRIRFGPDAYYVDEVDYRVRPDKAQAFARAIQRYLPAVGEADPFPEMAGVRPKLQGPGAGFRDFVVEESSVRGAPAMVHLLGIESPGLTAASALARRAVELCR